MHGSFSSYKLFGHLSGKARGRASFLQTRVIIQQEIRFTVLHLTHHSFMSHSGFCVSAHLVEFLVEGLILNRWFTRVRLPSRLRLRCIGCYCIGVVLQLFLYLSFEHRTKRVFIWAGQQFLSPIEQPTPSERLSIGG